MGRSKADLILHPARLRIISEVGGRQMTPQELAATLPDIPQATLYRHVKALLEGRVLEVVREQEVNGSVERTYTLAQGAGRLTEDELQNLSPEEHFRYFSIFAVKLMDDFAAYLRDANAEQVGKDGMSYSTAVIYLNSAERAAFQQQVIALISSVMALEPMPDRQRYSLSSIVIPDGKDSS